MTTFKNTIKTTLILLASITLLSSFAFPNDLLVKKQDHVSYSGGREFKSGTTLNITLDYVSIKKNREIVLELRKNDKWIASGKSLVKKGSGSVTVTLKFKERLRKASDYSFKYHIRPAGTTWKESITGGDIKGIKIK